MFEILNRTLIRLVPIADPRVDHLNSVVRRLARAIPAAIAAFLVVAAVSGPSLDARGDHDALASDSPGSVIGSELDALLAQKCLVCRPCDEDGHEILNQKPPPTGGHEAYHHYPCLERSGDCSSHPKCGANRDVAAAATDLINSLKASNPMQLAALLERNPHRMRINESRKALQLIGCRDQVVASYSVVSIPALAAFVS